MLLRQLQRRRARGREPVQARGAVGRQSRGAEGDGGGVRAASVLRMARHGLHLAIGAAHREAYAQWDAERALHVPGVRVTDPKAAQCGEVLKGVLKPRAVQAVRQRVHAGASGRRADGFVGRLVRGVLQLRAPQVARVAGHRRLRREHTGCAPSVAMRRPSALQGPADRDGARRRRQGQPPPGRRAVRAASARPTPSRLGDAARLHMADGTRIAITTDSFVVRPLRFPGGSIGELAVNGTVNDLAVSGARAEALVVTFVLEAGLPTAVLEAEVRAMAGAARRAGVSIVGGDTKVVEHGKADRMYITTTGIGRAMPRRHGRPRSRSGPATRSFSPDRSAITASPSCWRAATSISRPTCAPTRARCCRWSRLWSPRPAPASAGCAIRRAAASRPRSTNWRAIAGSASSSSRTRFRCATRCAARASCSASIRCTSPTKDSSWRWSRRSAPTRRSRRSSAAPGGEDARVDRRSAPQPAGHGARDDALRRHARVDMLVGDPLPRIC